MIIGWPEAFVVATIVICVTVFAIVAMGMWHER